ncbi:hypothetical protein EFA46_015365 (plasmid) [Halarchaeum sp. CBA1220]|uniref:hypothetical protein n=1 Tax=Halarchaeum sp. CBA1220 TaxID=1853682 RepID=UPI0011CEC9E1|nr:hypothetical protein [Halarchaeum sp. CBA1220]QLC35638.1 hypothetical protein EFA46_015365 [Halarchaeum sp. CBA1220]
MESAKQIREIGRSFAMGRLTEEELSTKLEEIHTTNPGYLPQHGMAFKAGLQDGNCDAVMKKQAWEILEDIDPSYHDFDYLGLGTGD